MSRWIARRRRSLLTINNYQITGGEGSRELVNLLNTGSLDLRITSAETVEDSHFFLLPFIISSTHRPHIPSSPDCSVPSAWMARLLQSLRQALGLSSSKPLPSFRQSIDTNFTVFRGEQCAKKNKHHTCSPSSHERQCQFTR